MTHILQDEDKEEEDMIDENGKSELERSHLMEELWEEGVKLPPEPTGQCSRQGFLIYSIVHEWKSGSN